MAKLGDLNELEKNRAILDAKGNVLCLWCEKRLAVVNEYGMIRKCNSPKCVKGKGFVAIINEAGVNKRYD